MADVSVIIPGRKEEFFALTVERVLAALRGDTEIIAVIDGEHDGPPLPRDPRVRVIENATPLGQRQSINLGVLASRAEFILKTDAHSLLDDGFDVTLPADCEYDWTVIPRMYNLHAYDLVCGGCGHRLNNHRGGVPCPHCNGPADRFTREIVWQPKRDKKTDWMYFRSPTCQDKPLRVQYYGNKDFVCTHCGYHHDNRGSHEKCQKCGRTDFRKELAYPKMFKAHRRWAKQQGQIADVMCGQGACWFLHRQRYWDLGGLDEDHGGWGQMGVEIACKAWLSGGRHVVNRNTWFAHFFRCGDGPHFPYKMSGKSQERARRYSIDFWSGGQWDKQVRPLSWLVEKFWPVPTWDKPKTTPELRQPAKPTPELNAVTRSPVFGTDGIERNADGEIVVSVLIPARNEQFLVQTVNDLRKNLYTPFEILIGIDGEQDPERYDRAGLAAMNDPRVIVDESHERIGMRPMINRLARQARGRFLLKLDAHCSIASAMDRELIAAWKPGGAVVPHRYDLDTKTWKKRTASRTDCRRLTHVSEDGVGLRALDWPEYSAAHADEEVSETMACSGSCWLMEREMFEQFGGWDEQHGTFGQEGCELACKIWLSGGRLLLNKRTWYAHWNRGKSPYSLGAHEKKRSIERSHELWLGNRWYFQKYDFTWLLEKFQPPGWPAIEEPKAVPMIRMGSPCKPWRGVTVEQLWRQRLALSEPGKRHRLAIFWEVFEDFVRAVLAEDHIAVQTGRYRQYLISHLKRTGLRRPSERETRHVDKKIGDAIRLIRDIEKNGFKAPLEFYRDLADERMILWKGYRRLVIAHVLGIEKVPLRSLFDRRTAGQRSPQNNMVRLQYPPNDRGRRVAEKQFQHWGSLSTDKYHVHNYIEWYDRYFPEMRKRCRRLLEVGLARGASLAFWREYFPDAELVGAEIDPKRWQQYAGDLKNCRVLIGDETDPTWLTQVAAAGPYDIIIDDADHHPRKQAAVFDALWPALRDYGWYVIEDIYRSFADNGQGRCVPADLEQRIFAEHHGGVGCGDIAEVHWHLNMVLIRKGVRG